jgi:hypothetical protein
MNQSPSSIRALTTVFLVIGMLGIQLLVFIVCASHLSYCGSSIKVSTYFFLYFILQVSSINSPLIFSTNINSCTWLRRVCPHFS